MKSPGAEPKSADLQVGLCRSCRHVRLVPTSRGSTFYLCRRSENDPRFARYPRLPVVECPGFEPGSESSDQ
jgi:hypothetical protein